MCKLLYFAVLSVIVSVRKVVCKCDQFIESFLQSHSQNQLDACDCVRSQHKVLQNVRLFGVILSECLLTNKHCDV